VPFFITPGSEQILQTCRRDGILDVFEQAGGTILANACGPCIGQWDRSEMPVGVPNSILTSFNRNFAGRNDGNRDTHNFLCSPELVTAMAFAGSLDFNPMTDALKLKGGKEFRFQPPSGDRLPRAGFQCPEGIPSAHPQANPNADIRVAPDSTRLQLLEPFPAWDGNDRHGLRVLIKVKGKCTVRQSLGW
jgi:aconitase A